MTEEQPFRPLGSPPEPTPPSEVSPPPELKPAPERYPFWSYADLGVFVGLLVASAIISIVLVVLAFSLFHIRMEAKIAEALIMQALLYVLAYFGLGLYFHMQYQRPFWSSLGWTEIRWPPVLVMACGVGTALGVGGVSILMRTPNIPNRMTEMMQDPKSVVPVGIFALTLGPLAEELGFRGFLQPLLVRSLGPVTGVIAAAIPFGVLHFQEYGNSWRHALLISLAGAAFGWMRYRTGSTQASTLMHASYNALEFIAFLAQPKDVPHT